LGIEKGRPLIADRGGNKLLMRMQDHAQASASGRIRRLRSRVGCRQVDRLPDGRKKL